MPSYAYDSRARPKPNSFYAPKPNRLVIDLVQRNIRGAIWRKLKVSDVEISDDDLKRLRKLASERCLLTPSHSGGFEPHVLMWLSRELNTYFNFLAAIEVFEQSPANRWCMPRLGCYSIHRGMIDRQSFAMTRKLLAAGERPVVIFPEGEAIWQNSTLVPFQPGVFQLAFKAMEDASDSEDIAHLKCVPMAIKYVFTADMQQEMNASLARLESHLELPAGDAPTNALSRLHRVALTVLEANEVAQGMRPSSDATLDDRIQTIKLSVISKLEHQFDIRPRNTESQLDRIRALFNAVDRIVHQDSPATPYAHRLATERVHMAQTIYGELWRLLEFVGVYDGYVSEAMTVERLMDILCLLENEVLGKRRVWGPRKAIVRVGQPVDLRDHYEEYTRDKRKTVHELTVAIENEVHTMLTELGNEHDTPMPAEAPAPA